jgi:hypothetical protein
LAGKGRRVTGHLIHIGYPKTGSNYLRNWFARHPQLGYADGGIAGFQNVYAMVRDSARFDPAPLYRVTSAEGFATPHGSFGLARVDLEAMRRQPMAPAQAAACALLADVFPDARILIVTRGFRAAALSAYSQHIRVGGHLPIRDFCGQGVGESPWDYDVLIRRYRAAFGDANVLVLPYELLRDDPRAFLRAISEPLGLDEIAIPAERANPSLSPAELVWYGRIARLLDRLPIPGRLWHITQRLWPRISQQNRLRGPIALLQWLFRAAPITESDLTDQVIASWIFPPESLRDNPHYRPYLRDYFLDRAR